MKTGYFILCSSEDGISIDGPLTADEVSKRITPDDEGYTYYGEIHGFYDRMPEMDKGHFMQREGKEKLLIIKGEIVVPKAREVVKAWEVG